MSVTRYTAGPLAELRAWLHRVAPRLARALLGCPVCAGWHRNPCPHLKVPDYGMENGCPEDMRDFWDALGWKKEDPKS